jgi:hypothetical protein
MRCLACALGILAASIPFGSGVDLSSQPNAPGTETLRGFRGDFASVFIPDLAPKCPEDPVTHIRCEGDDGAPARGLAAGAIFTPAIRNYTKAQRQRIYDAYTTGLGVDGRPRRYTHMPVNIFCQAGRWYHGIYPPYDCSGAALNDALREMYAHQPPIIPVCFALNDNERDVRLPGDFDRSLCRIIVAHWEHASSDCEMATVRAYFGPGPLLYWHNADNQNAGRPDACYPAAGQPPPSHAEWYRHAREAYGLAGVLLQTNQRASNPADVLPHVADFAARFGAGLHGWPTGLDLILFETHAYSTFWGGMTEPQVVRFNNPLLKYLRMPLCRDGGCGTVRGFLNGGTVS